MARKKQPEQQVAPIDSLKELVETLQELNQAHNGEGKQAQYVAACLRGHVQNVEQALMKAATHG